MQRRPRTVHRESFTDHIKITPITATIRFTLVHLPHTCTVSVHHRQLFLHPSPDPSNGYSMTKKKSYIKEIYSVVINAHKVSSGIPSFTNMVGVKAKTAAKGWQCESKVGPRPSSHRNSKCGWGDSPPL